MKTWLFYLLLGIGITLPSTLAILWAIYFPKAFKAFWKKTWKLATRFSEIVKGECQSLWKRFTKSFVKLRKESAKKERGAGKKGLMIKYALPAGVFITVIVLTFIVKRLLEIKPHIADDSTWGIPVIVLLVFALTALAIAASVAFKLKKSREGKKKLRGDTPEAEGGESADNKSWYLRPTSYIVLAGLVIAGLVAWKWSGELSATHAWVALGAACVIALIWYAVTRKEKTAETAAVAGGSPTDSITLKGLFAMIGVILFAVGWYTYIGNKAGRDIWSDVDATRIWFALFVIVGTAVVVSVSGKKTRGKGAIITGGLLLVALGMAIASTEVEKKVRSEMSVVQQAQQRVEQARQEAYRQQAAIMPPSAKRWHLRLQQWDKQLNALPDFTDYEAQVKRLDSDAVEFSSMFICHKCRVWHTTTFSWKREGEWGTWTQQCGKGSSSGRFKLQKTGVDTYQGQWTIDGFYTEYQLTLEGKIAPSFAL